MNKLFTIGILVVMSNMASASHEDLDSREFDLSIKIYTLMYGEDLDTEQKPLNTGLKLYWKLPSEDRRLLAQVEHHKRQDSGELGGWDADLLQIAEEAGISKYVWWRSLFWLD